MKNTLVILLIAVIYFGTSIPSKATSQSISFSTKKELRIKKKLSKLQKKKRIILNNYPFLIFLGIASIIAAATILDTGIYIGIAIGILSIYALAIFLLLILLIILLFSTPHLLH